MEAFQNIAQTNNWNLLLPEILLGVAALFLLLTEILVPNHKERIVAVVTYAALAGALYMLFSKVSIEDAVAFGGMIKQTSIANVMRIFFCVSAAFVVYLATLFFKKYEFLAQIEFYVITLVTTASMMLLVQANHFVMLFIALETLTVGLFVLVAYKRTSIFSLEGGLKFLILAALSSSILLFGIMLLFGAASNPTLPLATPNALEFSALTAFIQANATNIYVQIGAIMVLCGIAFKVGLVPFQIWIPDVYQGAPTPVTAYLAVSSKAAGVMLLLTLIQGPFSPLAFIVVPLLSAMAIVTILFGNITPLSQTNVKRILGLSGISHAGYLTIGVIASLYVDWAQSAVIFYLFTYLLASYLVFAVMMHVRIKDDAVHDLEHYDAFAKKNPFLGSALAFGIASLAGVPPLVGFIGKMLIFVVAFKAKLYVLLGVAAVGVVISIYYYFGWIRDAFFYTWKAVSPEEELAEEQKDSSAALKVSRVHKLVIAALVLAVVILGFYQGGIGELFV